MADFEEESRYLLDGESEENDGKWAISTNIPRNQLFNRKTRTFADARPNLPLVVGENCREADDSTVGPRSKVNDVADIISVFVVAFDTRAGNIVEWCVPENSNLDGVEFKAMASGSHQITYDFIYFKKGSLYGVSCFENMPVDSRLERGARMKSVGVVASSYRQLHHYKPFLEAQVTLLLKSPGNYEHLREFYDARKGILPSSRFLRESTISRPQTLQDDFKIAHPAGCFAQFVRFFGERIFVLWKFALLQKRILFFSPPPIGVVCYRVYCANCLSNFSVQQLTPMTSNVMFYINVADIDALDGVNQYIACTTEKIFEAKQQLFDVYVDNQNIVVPSPALSEMASATAADKTRFTKLCDDKSDMSAFSYESDGSKQESAFVSFFTNLNNELFTMLLEASWTRERLVSADDVRRVGLDPNGDWKFLVQLVELYGIDIELPADNPCCPV